MAQAAAQRLSALPDFAQGRHELSAGAAVQPASPLAHRRAQERDLRALDKRAHRVACVPRPLGTGQPSAYPAIQKARTRRSPSTLAGNLPPVFGWL